MLSPNKEIMLKTLGLNCIITPISINLGKKINNADIMLIVNIMSIFQLVSDEQLDKDLP